MKKALSKTIERKMKIRKKDEQQEKKQLGLNLKFSRLELLYKIKRLAAKVEKNFTVLPFWRNGLIWLTITSIIGVTIITTLLISKDYNRLPHDIPLFYDILKGEWKSTAKIYLFAVPLILVSVGIINIQLLQRVYYMNKKLILMICVLLTVTYFLCLIAVNEILVICTS